MCGGSISAGRGGEEERGAAATSKQLPGKNAVGAEFSVAAAALRARSSSTRSEEASSPGLRGFLTGGTAAVVQATAVGGERAPWLTVMVTLEAAARGG